MPRWPTRHPTAPSSGCGDTSGGGPGNDFAYALAIRPNGSAVYVTGESQASNGFNDFATLAYKLH